MKLFIDQLIKKIKQKNTPCIVGLDPAFERMPDQEISVSAHTGYDGTVHLDMELTTSIINQDIQITVSYKESQELTLLEDDFQEILGEVQPASRLDKHAGSIALKEDPLTFQKRIRSEW